MNEESIKRRLLIKYPFFGSIIAYSNFIAESAVKTVGTDGKNIYYNPNFIESITDEEQLFIFVHEICHIAFDHISRRKGKDPKLWNTATDSVVNAFLKHDGLPIVAGAVDISEAINYDAEEMYKKLLEKKKQQQRSNEQGNGQNQKVGQQQSNGYEQSGSGSGEDSQQKEKQQNVGHDTHSMWDKTFEKSHREEQSQFNVRQSEDKNKTSLLDKLSKLFNRKKKQQKKEKKEEIKKLIELGEKEAFEQNRKVRKKQLEELRELLVSQSYNGSNDLESERRNIADIGVSAPLIEWRKLLKEAIKYDVDWSYQNASIEDGVVTAHLEEIPQPETEILLDTSGSIDETLLKDFLRECKNILKISKVKVGCFDTQFYGFREIKNLYDIDNLELHGGGGTDFNVAVNSFTRRVENKIIFTDGYADMPNNSVNAIWVVFGNDEIHPKGGKIIYIDEQQLRNRNNDQVTKKKTLFR